MHLQYVHQIILKILPKMTITSMVKTQNSDIIFDMSKKENITITIPSQSTLCKNK